MARKRPKPQLSGLDTGLMPATAAQARSANPQLAALAFGLLPAAAARRLDASAVSGLTSLSMLAKLVPTLWIASTTPGGD